MKIANYGSDWRPIRQFEIESVNIYAHRECRYHKIGSWFIIAFIVAVFSIPAVSFSISNSWNVLSVIVFMLAFLLVISLPVYLHVQENRKFKMIIDGKVRCMTVIVLSKRIRSSIYGGGTYVVGIKRPDDSKLAKRKMREYDVSRKTYNAIQVNGKGLLIRFDNGIDEKSASRYRFLPLV